MEKLAMMEMNILTGLVNAQGFCARPLIRFFQQVVMKNCDISKAKNDKCRYSAVWRIQLPGADQYGSQI